MSKGGNYARNIGINNKGSKYVQSDIAYKLREMKNDLNKHVVLFVGNPCKVAAINSVYNCDNLYTVSFVCGGVPSEKNLRDHLKSQGIDYYDIDKIDFRDKSEHLLRIINQGKVFFKKIGNLVTIYMLLIDRCR